MPEHEQHREGTGRRAEDCGKCPDHTGMVEKDNTQLNWLKATFAVMTIALGMMSYSVVFQAPNIQTSIALINDRIDTVRSEMRTNDVELGRRVNTIESMVYQRVK
jgi:hypothetical protein